MRNDLPSLSKKTITKLINPKYRRGLLSKVNLNKPYGISDYARYVIDCQIVQRIKEYSGDAKSNWGFPQLNIICAVKKDGTIDKKLFEFNAMNHFLKDSDGDSAVEVVECILALWANMDKTISSFDYELIDAELKKLDEAEKVAEKTEDEKQETENAGELSTNESQLSGFKSPDVGPVGTCSC